MSPDAVVGAAYTLLGAVAGALIAFIPMTIIGVMSRLSDDQRAARLVSEEIKQLRDYASRVSSSDSPSTYVFPPTPAAAWTYALGRPSFILSLSPQTFEQLSAIAESASVLEDVFNRVRLSNSMMATSPSWGGQHDNTKEGLNKMLRDAAGLVINRIDAADMKMDILSEYRRDIETKLLWWRIVIGALVVIAVIGIVVGALLLHADHTSTSPKA